MKRKAIIVCDDNPVRRVKNIEYEITEKGCWNCTSHSGSGSGLYPRRRVNGKETRLSHYMYERFIGKIPEGLLMRHTCDNKQCINPEHLIPGTQAQNYADSKERDRHCKGEWHGMSILKEEQVLEIYKDTQSTCAQLGIKYGVHRSTIWLIKKGKKWSWLTKQIER